MHNKILKNRIARHLIAGFFFCATFLTFLYSQNYKDMLQRTISKISRIKTNKNKIKKDTLAIKQTLIELNAILPSDFGKTTKNADSGNILLNLDGIKKRYSNIKFKVDQFFENPVGLFLPVTLTFPMEDYSQMVSLIIYLERMNFPHFRLGSFLINIDINNNLICEIKGFIIMPSEIAIEEEADDNNNY